MAVNRGLVDLIGAALDNDAIPAGKMNQECSRILKDLAQKGMAHQAQEGPFGGSIITQRSRPEFLIVPIANTPEYLQAIAEHAAKRAAEAAGEDAESFTAKLKKAIEAPQ